MIKKTQFSCFITGGYGKALAGRTIYEISIRNGTSSYGYKQAKSEILRFGINPSFSLVSEDLRWIFQTGINYIYLFNYHNYQFTDPNNHVSGIYFEPSITALKNMNKRLRMSFQGGLNFGQTTTSTWFPVRNLFVSVGVKIKINSRRLQGSQI